MKKQNLKSLKLNKESIVNFKVVQLQGGKRGTDDITNCGSLCMQETPKTVDGCNPGTTHTSVNTAGGAPTYCDAGN